MRTKVHGYLIGGVLFFAIVAFIGCSVVPVTGRREFTGLVSPSQEMQLGLTSFDQLKKDTPISRDPAINALVQTVGKRIASVAELPNAQWEFVVFDSKEANAFCLPGGKVGIYTGILPITQDEAGLATVIGHEVAHAVARHGAERMSEATALQAVGQVSGAVVQQKYGLNPQVFEVAYGAATTVGRELPHSRKQESEADHIGLVYMARAGYEPASAIAFWQRFSAYNKKAGGDAGPAFLRTHPVDDVRIEQLKQWLPEAQAQYRSK